MKRLALVGVCLLSAACGSSSSPTSPSPSPAAVTRVITVAGDLGFGNVNFGDTPTRTFTIGNTGNATLTFTGMTAVGGTGTAGFSATPNSGTVAPGGTQTVTVRFTPTLAQFYSNVLTIASDRTTGGNEINVSGTGVNNTPLFTRSGSGDVRSSGTAAQFNMPTSVTRVRVTASTTSSCENFVVDVAGRLFINVIIGTCSVADFRSLDATFATSGGPVEVRLAGGQTSWSFTEVR